jgi:hypothetical protein
MAARLVKVLHGFSNAFPVKNIESGFYDQKLNMHAKIVNFKKVLP